MLLFREQTPSREPPTFTLTRSPKGAFCKSLCPCVCLPAEISCSEGLVPRTAHRGVHTCAVPKVPHKAAFEQEIAVGLRVAVLVIKIGKQATFSGDGGLWQPTSSLGCPPGQAEAPMGDGLPTTARSLRGPQALPGRRCRTMSGTVGPPRPALIWTTKALASCGQDGACPSVHSQCQRHFTSIVLAQLGLPNFIVSFSD